MEMYLKGFSDEISALQPGMRVGNLEITRFIGKGGMGEVYQVRHAMLGKDYALKLIPRGFTDDEEDEALRAAAALQSRLDHPAFVRIDDMGEESVFFWMRMELIEGGRAPDNTFIRSLEDLLRYRRGPLSEEEVSYFLYHILAGLDHAHHLGEVHGDLKPANIFLADDGVKISELGLTKLIGHAWDDFHLFQTEDRINPTPFDPLPGFSRSLPALLATFEYYSPEQRAGGEPDARGNLYTVGLIAYRLLTGRLRLGLEAPGETVKGIDPRWNGWLRRALAYDPVERFQAAAEMVESMPGLERANSVREPAPGGMPANFKS